LPAFTRNTPLFLSISIGTLCAGSVFEELH
jgi:hypothetical protein